MKASRAVIVTAKTLASVEMKLDLLLKHLKVEVPGEETSDLSVAEIKAIEMEKAREEAASAPKPATPPSEGTAAEGVTEAPEQVLKSTRRSRTA